MLARKMAAYSDLNFEDVLRISLGKYDEHLILKGKQVECSCEIYNGKDVIGNLPTGYGKSTCSLHAHVSKTFKVKVICESIPQHMAEP